ncbi:DISARM system phospholipase D-like protein DrmC [Bifidobacterium pseudolongum]|uniref:Phospholipase n=1 Tax=Bifidobacterium pseudolongum subsp. globosum TaxID=1690 RepID=A0A2N3QS46_9BIFI|nr:DISARM system phospholipase D-like protein DrmC [Bifidobacterium pseudolongum]PKU94622.1 phospholipase [Bifidobacterium pseudolongum subsp. globosum]PKV02453.1 phospholipase [Bifidobacterium pseudolongum subsp. globosum]RYQ49173.1 phospholipase [Bifidobacterium pseudolongum subsp. pseudolongum]RYQ73224.1 phospholipase [Bifidobacterium pseudolongum subsp. globosum]RYQ74395.1 phospholipase [Bifidobacterium pseudolongum subsp. globosum]
MGNKESQEAAIALGRFLTDIEARGIAERLDAGRTLTQALSCVAKPRQARVRELMDRIAPSTDPGCRRERLLALRAIEGARTEAARIRTVWTAPHGLAKTGELNSSRDRLIDGAERSIVCSTYNFQRSSALWNALARASSRPGIEVRIYVDAEANREEHDGCRNDHSTPRDIAAAFPGARVFETVPDGNGRPYRNHAKFLSIDQHVLLVTSANFSLSAEERNIELGLRIDDAHLAKSVEDQMRQFEHILYQRVQPE